MNENQKTKIEAHGRNLLYIFPNATQRDPIKLCKSLRRYEAQAYAVTLRLCNGPEYENEHTADNLLDAVLAKVNVLLGNTGKDYAEAVEKYRAGNYSMKAPPVCTAQWDEASWLAFIFGVYPPVPVFVNRDPRGCALKIDDAWMKSTRNRLGRKPTLEQDWGGYGLIAPEIE